MATRSTIAIRNADTTVTGIYCHWDGYLAHNGKILVENYTTESAVRELIALGNLSSLGETVGTKANFNLLNEGQCVAYGRDRGESNQSGATFGGWQALLDNAGEEYNYLFVPGEGWYVEYYGRRGLVVNEMTEKEMDR